MTAIPTAGNLGWPYAYFKFTSNQDGSEDWCYHVVDRRTGRVQVLCESHAEAKAVMAHLNAAVEEEDGRE